MKKSILIAAVLILTLTSFIFGQGVIPTPDFETWATHGTTTTWQEPVGWKSIDSFAVQLTAPAPVTKDSINPHGGSYDIQLQTKTFFGQNYPGAACTGNFNIVTLSPLVYTITGGFPATTKAAALAGWYRDSLVGTGDTAYIISFYTKWDNTLGKRDTVAYGGMKIGTSNLSWTHFQFNIINDSINAVAPDSGMVVLISGRVPGTIVGTTLWVDDLSLLTGIDDVDPLNSNYDLYPNPVSRNLYVKNNNFIRKNAVMNIYDEMGRNVNAYNLNDNLSVLNISSLSSGIYFYQIISTNQSIMKKGKFIVE
jgi:type IX secretion system substrate protein